MTSILIGRGSYGIIFYPPIPCESLKFKINDETLFVGKVFLNKKDSAKEWKNSVIIKKLPNYFSYFIISMYYSKIPVNTLSTYLNYDDKNQYLKNKNQLFFYQHYKYQGGLSIYKYFHNNFRKSQVSHFEIIYLLQNIFYAIDYLIKNNYAHQDISMNNILVHNLNSKIIDLGFNLIHFKNFYNIPISKTLRNDNPLLAKDFKYYLNPPEYHLIHQCDLLNKLKESPNNIEYLNLIINNIKSNLNIAINDTRLYKLYNNYINNNIWNTDFKYYLNDIFKKVETINTTSMIEYYKKLYIHTKSDLYSLGIIMLSLDKYINLKYFKSNRNLNIHKEYIKLITGLINPSPIHRINITIAIYYIKKIKNFHSYGSQ